MMVVGYDYGIGYDISDVVVLLLMAAVVWCCAKDGNIDGILVGVVWPLLEHLGF